MQNQNMIFEYLIIKGCPNVETTRAVDIKGRNIEN
jgi:hypothetical protein